jgi:hypothetical protein
MTSSVVGRQPQRWRQPPDSTTRGSRAHDLGQAAVRQPPEPEFVEWSTVVRSGRAKVAVKHIEVFQMGHVGTSILRETSTPMRPPTRPSRATAVNCGEPDLAEWEGHNASGWR